jgi:hypothetical protein
MKTEIKKMSIFISFERNTPDQIKICFDAKNCKVFETIFD